MEYEQESQVENIPVFSYNEAFSRNIGWVTKSEQEQLKNKRVAIAGLGGVGGVHLLTLARLGISKFHIADFDYFDVPNFNRQVGATVSTLGKSKSQVLTDMARDINPEIEITVFPEGVNKGNIDKFLHGVDIYVDSLDFFAFEAREVTFGACARLGIPATTAAPLGMGAAIMNFIPGKMTFEEYFQWEGKSDEQKALNFLLGLAPRGLHGAYLVDPSAVNFRERRGPSTIMACQICAGIAATETLKILLNRGKVICAPRGMHFDAYRSKLVYTWRPGGLKNPLCKIAMMVVKKKIGIK